MPYPPWLHILAWTYLSLCFACALGIALHELRRPQHMWIMNLVWPITALYLGPAALFAYLRSGRKLTHEHHRHMQQEVKAEVQQASPAKRAQMAAAPEMPPSREQVAVGTMHCGAGCTLGDIAGEWWVFLAALTFAGGDLQTRLLLTFLLAWALGVAFQYFTIVPMRGLSPGKGLMVAMRADTASIAAYQFGMAAWDALAYFVIFPAQHLHTNQAVFWFMMQIGMVIGFFCSYPVNVFLLKKKWKEKMPQYQAGMRRKMAKQKLQERPEQAA